MMVRTSDGCVRNETRQEYDVTSSFLPGTFSCQDTGQNWWLKPFFRSAGTCLYYRMGLM